MSEAYGKLSSPDECLLLVVDLQDKFVRHLRRADGVLRSADLLLHTAEVLHVPIVVTEHHPEAIGPTLEPVSNHLDGAGLFRKDVFGCFGDEEIRRAVTEKKGRRTLLLAGCETHICIMQTALQALELGFDVYVAADGVSSRTELDWKIGLERMGRAGAVTATSEMIAYELLRRSDIPEFKKLLPVFKEWVRREHE